MSDHKLHATGMGLSLTVGVQAVSELGRTNLDNKYRKRLGQISGVNRGWAGWVLCPPRSLLISGEILAK